MTRYFAHLTEKDIIRFLKKLGYPVLQEGKIIKSRDEMGYITYSQDRIELKTKQGVKGFFNIHIKIQNFECEICSYSNFLGEKRTTFKKDYAEFLYNELLFIDSDLAKQYKEEYNKHILASVQKELID